MFFTHEIFLGCAPKILDRHYKIGPSTDHQAKFHAGRLTHFGDLALNNNIVAKHKQLEIWGKAQRESSRRLSLTGGKLEGKGKISLASKSRGRNSNALAYPERALST